MIKISNLEKKISEIYYELEQQQQHIFHLDMNEYDSQDRAEEISQLRHYHNAMIKSLHNQIICYLDALDLHRYLEIFIKKFNELPDVDKAYHGIDYDHMENDISNEYLHELWHFLSPFDFFKTDNRFTKSGVQYLETILKNTQNIIFKLNRTPTTETQVYDSVKIIIESIFPTSQKPKHNFIKTMKTYNPDILIPELNVAIEYKYANNEAKLKSTVEQVVSDVQGYTGDNDYNLFYAVFYVTEDFWGKDRFNEIWKEHKFPKNWKAYYIIGKNT